MAAGSDEDWLIERALGAARDTKVLEVREGVRHEAAGVFVRHFGDAQPVIVADEKTWAAAGLDVSNGFARERPPGCPAFVFGPDVYAEERCVDELTGVLASSAAIPVAVGSGTINDLTKLAAHRVGRPYMVVATAASMDGYTAYGASITAKGSKQTFDCPAPKVVLADLEIIARAPVGMNASGYADLIAKVAAGADWIVADALEVEAIDADVWNTVQLHLKEWVDAPAAVAGGEPGVLKRLTNGLMMTGFAMQAHKTSRPASGADHQFSHLWDMQHHTHEGVAPSHGFKVGIGTVASLAMYEELLSRDLGTLDIDEAVSRWPTLESFHSQIRELFGEGELADTAHKEMAAKYVGREALRGQLERLREVWPELRGKLEKQVIGVARLKQMLREAGCPCEPEEIGISLERLRKSYWQALFIRRRFTVLDLAQRTGLLEGALGKLFGVGGCWGRTT
jgi:glycerol-1-phosphate dehydrogenase [NAD(P)+]